MYHCLGKPVKSTGNPHIHVKPGNRLAASAALNSGVGRPLLYDELLASGYGEMRWQQEALGPSNTVFFMRRGVLRWCGHDVRIKIHYLGSADLMRHESVFDSVIVQRCS